jgi:hypothetical protein
MIRVMLLEDMAHIMVNFLALESIIHAGEGLPPLLIASYLNYSIEILNQTRKSQ